MRRKQLKDIRKKLAIRYYHYTSKVHVANILKSGHLKLTESNLKHDVELYKPVVWLTTKAIPNDFELGLDGSVVDKTEVKIIVKPQKHFKTWTKFKKENAPLNNKWIDVLENNRTPESWYISEKEVPLSQVELIENRYTKEVYYKGGVE